MTKAHAYAIIHPPKDKTPAQFEQEAQSRADFLESALLSTGPRLVPGERGAVFPNLAWFVNNDVLLRRDLDSSYCDRPRIVSACKEFAYGEVEEDETLIDHYEPLMVEVV